GDLFLRSVLVCLLQGQWDRGTDQFERSALGGGRHGDLVEGHLVEGDGVAGQGCHVFEQATEAVEPFAGGVEVVGGFVVGVGGSGRGGDRVVPLWRVFVGVGQRGQCMA